MQSFYELCSRRRSVRSFSDQPISSETLAEIAAFAESVEPLLPQVKSTFEILDHDTVKGLFSIKAPYYLCLYQTPATGHFSHGGYVMEQMDLYLASRGIGACWQGMAKPPKELVHRKKEMDYVTMLALGVPAPGEELLRSHLSQFKRKPLEGIAEAALLSDTETRAILETARLAPSATNSQPWYFSGTPEDLKVNRIKLPPIKASLYEKMNQIDIGIALCFLKQAAMERGLSAEPYLDGTGTAPKGCSPAAGILLRHESAERDV